MNIRRMFPLAAVALIAGCSVPTWAAIRVAQLREPIHPVSASFLERVLQQADSVGDELVVVELDTPGGLADSMKAIIQNVIHSPVPVCVFVAPSGSVTAASSPLPV